MRSKSSIGYVGIIERTVVTIGGRTTTLTTVIIIFTFLLVPVNIGPKIGFCSSLHGFGSWLLLIGDQKLPDSPTEVCMYLYQNNLSVL